MKNDEISLVISARLNPKTTFCRDNCDESIVEESITLFLILIK
jgi:hypothetical protein